MNEYTIEQSESNVLIVRFEDVCAGWEQWVMLSSDRHHDNRGCMRDLERRHLELAKKRGALIVDCGDLFCAMQGKYDPRSSLDAIRPEDVGEDYLDRIVKHAAQDYGPYAENWLILGRGNHESNIRKRHGMDLTSNLAHRLNADYGGRVSVGGYGGWVRFVFRINKTKGSSCNLKYFHGKSTSAPVTKGVIQTARQAVYLPDADIVLNGHNHEAYILPLPRERISQQGRLGQDTVDFVRTPGYANLWRKGELGYAAELGGPKAFGCAWILFYYDKDAVGRQVILTVT